MGYGGSYGNLTSGSGGSSTSFPIISGLNAYTAFDSSVGAQMPAPPIVGAKLLTFLMLDTTITVTSVPTGWTLIDNRVQDVTRFRVYEFTVTEDETLSSFWSWGLNASTNVGAVTLQVAHIDSLDSTLGSNNTNTTPSTGAMTAANEGSLHVLVSRKGDGTLIESSWTPDYSMLSAYNENNLMYAIQAAVVPAGQTRTISHQASTASLWNRMGYLFNPEGV